MNHIKLPDAQLPNMYYESKLATVNSPKYAMGEKVRMIDSDSHPDYWEEYRIIGYLLDVYPDTRTNKNTDYLELLLEPTITYLISHRLGGYWKKTSDIEVGHADEVELMSDTEYRVTLDSLIEDYEEMVRLEN